MARRPTILLKDKLFQSAPSHPPIDFETLCQLLELEVLLGQHAAFRRRLLRALGDMQSPRKRSAALK